MHHDSRRFTHPDKFNVSSRLSPYAHAGSRCSRKLWIKAGDPFTPILTFFLILASTLYSLPPHLQPDHYFNDKHTSSESANLANPWERDHWMFGAGCAYSIFLPTSASLTCSYFICIAAAFAQAWLSPSVKYSWLLRAYYGRSEWKRSLASQSI